MRIKSVIAIVLLCATASIGGAAYYVTRALGDTTSLQAVVAAHNSAAKRAPLVIASPSVLIGTTVIPVEVARDQDTIIKGLSGRIALPVREGMLFVFSRKGTYSFWMPDMHFPIDIIWIADGAVVDIDERVSNEFDPTNPKFYTPARPAQYVLEVNSGFAERTGIAIGDRVVINFTE